MGSGFDNPSLVGVFSRVGVGVKYGTMYMREVVSGMNQQVLIRGGGGGVPFWHRLQ